MVWECTLKLSALAAFSSPFHHVYMQRGLPLLATSNTARCTSEFERCELALSLPKLRNSTSGGSSHLSSHKNSPVMIPEKKKRNTFQICLVIDRFQLQIQIASLRPAEKKKHSIWTHTQKSLTLKTLYRPQHVNEDLYKCMHLHQPSSYKTG